MGTVSTFVLSALFAKMVKNYEHICAFYSFFCNFARAGEILGVYVRRAWVWYDKYEKIMNTCMKFYRYCTRCATPYSEEQMALVRVGAPKVHCQSCGLTIYNNPKTATGLIGTHQGQYFLVERGIEPYKGTLDFAGGFVDYGESAETALCREIKEELDCDPDEYEVKDILGVFHSMYENQGRADEEYSVNSIVYQVEFQSMDFTVQDDVSDYQWFPIGHIPPNIGFPGMEDFLREVMPRLR